MQPQICLLIFPLDKILFFSHQKPSWVTILKSFVPSMWKKPGPSLDFKKKLIASLQKSHLVAISGILINNKLTFLQNSPLYQDMFSCPPASSLQIFWVLLQLHLQIFFLCLSMFPGLNTKFSHKKLGSCLISRYNQAHHNSSIEWET